MLIGKINLIVNRGDLYIKCNLGRSIIQSRENKKNAFQLLLTDRKNVLVFQT